MKKLSINKNTSKSRLCYFGSVNYIFLASSLALALSEELSADDINILAAFLDVLSDELALIAALDSCDNDGTNEILIPPAPDAAITDSDNFKKTPHKKVCKKKIIKKKRIKKRKN